MCLRITMKKKAAIFAIILIILAANCARIGVTPPGGARPEISVIPLPQKAERLPGVFLLSQETTIIAPAANEEIMRVAEYLRDRLKEGTGWELNIFSNPPGEADRSSGNSLIINMIEGAAGKSGEYSLTVDPMAAKLEAQDAAGLFYAGQTLLELLPSEIFSGAAVPGIRWTIPAVRIEDAPRYPWRGMLLDVSRHFFPKEFVKKFIDFLAMHKMNTFHWHLTDDQGWRIEIKKYPRLTEVGAWRADREADVWTRREPQREGEKATYGGFYTQEDIRDVVEYAKRRFVTVVPEIEMPGHCMSALAAYPQYSCTGGPFTVPTGSVWPITHVYCPGNDETFRFLEGVLDEVIGLFPGEYIHIGGDEVDKANWKICPKCQARMKAEGLKTEEELQSWFIRRIEEFLNGRGKKLIGWDEILEGGLAPNAAVMSWRGTEGGIAAAREGHDVAMTPTSHCYFDYYQGRPGIEPLAIGGNLPLGKVYSFEPTPAELEAGQARHILGVQANLWTEYISAPSHAEYMTFPRIAAIAEAGWTAKERRSWDGFKARLNAQFERYQRAGINFAKSAFDVGLEPAVDPETKTMVVRMGTETHAPDIRYTLDGSDPRPDSPRYTIPLRVSRTAVIKAGAFEGGRLQGKITETRFAAHKAMGRPVKLAFPYKERYKGGGEIGLTDGLRGALSHTDGRWQGFEGDDLIAEIDLGRRQKISRITAGFLQNIDSWIFFPVSVEFAVSGDGREYRTVSEIANDVSQQSAGALLKEFAANPPGLKARFIRVRAKSVGVCPDGHPGKGGKAWIFADEIIVE